MVHNKTSNSSRKRMNNAASYQLFKISLNIFIKNLRKPELLSQIMVWRYHLYFYSYQKRKVQNGAESHTSCACMTTGNYDLLSNFVRYSARQQINNTIMTQKPLLDKVVCGIQDDLSLYTLLWEGTERVKCDSENISDQVPQSTCSRRALSSNKYLKDVPKNSGLRIKQKMKIK